ncbi:MAG: sulfotransferase domain-containing protein [Gemmataceae bacterium]
MTQNANNWKRLLECYKLDDRLRQVRHEGLTTLGARARYKLLRLKYQFLPHYFSRAPRWRVWLRSLTGPRTLPDFACVGALKCGTSDLATYLFQHPCILPPLCKEVTARDTKMWLPYYPTVREKERVAREHGMALCGHFNPLLHGVTLMDAYYAARPDAKVILMLRNPIDRAYSHYKWSILLGGKGLRQNQYYKTFAACVTTSIELFPTVPFPSGSRFDVLQTGIYVKAVELWIRRFGRENVFVVRAEDFFEETALTVCKIHEFLGIPALAPELHEVVNKNPLSVPPMDEETRQTLQAFYHPWNDMLYRVLDRDMGWG